MFALFIAESERWRMSKKVQEEAGMRAQPAGCCTRKWPPCLAFAAEFLNDGEFSHLSQIRHKPFCK